MPYGPLPFALETERLTLQLWQESDAEGYRQLVVERKRDHAERTGGLEQHVDEPMSLDEALADIRGARESAPARGIHLLTLHPRGSDEFLGYCGLVVGRSTIDEPELAYELLRSAHGHGYATEAAAAVVEAARATGRQRLWATVGSWNAPSFRVLDKLGFRRDRTAIEEQAGEIVWTVLDLA
ncbi:GNAT family N-acetyltransferase [Agromyces sp. NPDC058126]|uniref:GNAT family N-acetyltransferase n=1 Tax=Agromyces sp. NPDC058126 TaxID=3346350 RepID=UPI0036DB8E7A